MPQISLETLTVLVALSAMDAIRLTPHKYWLLISLFASINLSPFLIRSIYYQFCHYFDTSYKYLIHLKNNSDRFYIQLHSQVNNKLGLQFFVFDFKRIKYSWDNTQQIRVHFDIEDSRFAIITLGKSWLKGRRKLAKLFFTSTTWTYLSISETNSN